jgi:hypothetical protein
MVTNSFAKTNFMQPMGRLSVHSKCLDFFPFKFWGGGGEDFFHFLGGSQHVPFQVPMGSQQVPNVFPIAPRLIPYVLPKVLPFSPI